MPRFTLLALLCLAACGRTEPYRFAGILNDGGPDDLLDAGEPDAGVVPCTPGKLALTPAAPVVMFVLDRSTSMNTRFGTSGNRWQALTNALAAALPPSDATMQTGAYIFPGGGGSLTCVAPAGAAFAPATGNVTPLIDLMRRTNPSGSTPTADAITNAANALRGARAAGTARALVLATDGAPDCNAMLDFRTCTCVNGGSSCTATRCLDDQRCVDRLSALAAEGLPTYVIGIQDEDETNLVGALNRMAVAGGRPRVDPGQRYFPATSQAALQNAFEVIRDQVAGCVFLTTSVPDADGSLVLTLDGTPVPEDPENGWRWSNKSNGELILTGAACEVAERRSDFLLEAEVACAISGQ